MIWCWWLAAGPSLLGELRKSIGIAILGSQRYEDGEQGILWMASGSLCFLRRVQRRRDDDLDFFLLLCDEWLLFSRSIQDRDNVVHTALFGVAARKYCGS